MEEHFKNQLKEFDAAAELLLQLGEAVAKADNGKVFGLDLLAMGALRRALALLRGFRLLIEDRNLISAAPLVRLQLDTALRFYAGTLVDDPHGFAVEVLEGKRIDRINDRNGKLMRDAYLVEKLSSIYPWVQNVYSQTSGYVHLSEKHMFSAVEKVEADRQVKFRLAGQEQEDFPLELYSEAIDAFLEITKVFAQLLGSWGHSKEKAADEGKEDTKGQNRETT